MNQPLVLLILFLVSGCCHGQQFGRPMYDYDDYLDPMYNFEYELSLNKRPNVAGGRPTNMAGGGGGVNMGASVSVNGGPSLGGGGSLVNSGSTVTTHHVTGSASMNSGSVAGGPVVNSASSVASGPNVAGGGSVTIGSSMTGGSATNTGASMSVGPSVASGGSSLSGGASLTSGSNMVTGGSNMVSGTNTVGGSSVVNGQSVSSSAMSPSLDYSNEVVPLRCGQTRGQFPSSRVVGGRKAMDGEFPWQVAIEMNKHDDKEPRQFCGGVIIDEDWVLTAAHCVQGMKQDNLEIEVGSTDINDDDQSVTIRFDDVIVHEDYNNKTMMNDIALVKPRRRIPLDTRSNEVEINSVCLPGAMDEISGKATVTGFGYLEEGDGQGSSEMRATDVMILPSSKCEESYEHFDPEIMLCAGWPEGGQDACQGDSGGPLVQKQADGSVLLGIVSYGKGCARQDTPGVYTRVSAYINWINDQIN